ncbi:hypothetical protein HZA71_02560 [Candidatus Falkowbacteria bacterium]|nr:hypothetical protein [Candidatus Falkowbacteria bacterium]
MNQESVFSAKNSEAIAVITILFVALVVILGLAQTPKYQSSVKLLTVFNQEKIDPYTASRASAYLTNVLSEVIYSTSFVDNVFKTNFDLKDNLGVNQEKRQKNWKAMVKVKLQEDRGIIDINVLNENRDQADQFAQAITYTIITKYQLYHGFGDKVSVKIINSPITSTGWAQPKIVRNAFIGLITGFIFGLTIVVIFPQQNILTLLSFRIKKMATQDETIELVNREPRLPANADKINQYAVSRKNNYRVNFLDPAGSHEPIQSDQSDDNQYYGW